MIKKGISDPTRISLRFNENNPEHMRAVQILRDTNYIGSLSDYIALCVTHYTEHQKPELWENSKKNDIFANIPKEAPKKKNTPKKAKNIDDYIIKDEPETTVLDVNDLIIDDFEDIDYRRSTPRDSAAISFLADSAADIFG